MAVISEAQEKGIVRTHGTSCHTLGALTTAARSVWVEVDCFTIGTESRAEMEDLMKRIPAASVRG